VAAAPAWCSLPPGARLNGLMRGSSSAATLPSVVCEAWEASAVANRPSEMWAPVRRCKRASACDCCCGSDRLPGQLVPRGLSAIATKWWKQRE
jgi:hypothetical protein